MTVLVPTSLERGVSAMFRPGSARSALACARVFPTRFPGKATVGVVGSVDARGLVGLGSVVGRVVLSGRPAEGSGPGVGLGEEEGEVCVPGPMARVASGAAVMTAAASAPAPRRANAARAIRWGPRDLLGVLSGVVASSSEELVEHAPGRVEVGAGIDGSALCLLGGHVGGGADRAARPGHPLVVSVGDVGDPEVHDLDRPVSGDHDVGRLDVPVDQPGRVCAAECFQRSRDPVDRFLRRGRG